MASGLLAGLAKGFGSGLEKVGVSRIEEEKAKAAALRAQNHARFQQKLAQENQDRAWDREDGMLEDRYVREDTLTQAARDREDALLKAKIERERKQREEDQGLVGDKVKGVDEEGNPVWKFVNKKGEETGATIERNPEKGEAGYIDPDGKPGVKIESSMYKIGLNNIFTDIFSKYSKSLEGKDVDMKEYMIVNADGTSGGLNKEIIYSQLPKEMADELITKTQLMERGMEAGYNPAAATEYAKKQWDQMEERKKADTSEKIDAFVSKENWDAKPVNESSLAELDKVLRSITDPKLRNLYGNAIAGKNKELVEEYMKRNTQ